MIKKYNNISLTLGIPGLVAQTASQIYPWAPGDDGLAFLALLLGTTLLLIGLAFYAMAKGRNPAWCLFAFLSIIGLIVLGMLKDKSATQSAAN